jgi:D-alanyl-lipoteichoic acid acyltransferase DltB (MBOAT superfamily)
MPLTIKTHNQALALFTTMLTVGLWHAFSLSWFAWSAHHAAGLVVSSHLSAYSKKQWKFLWRLCATGLTLLFVSGGFYFSFVSDFPTALSAYLRFWGALILLR